MSEDRMPKVLPRISAGGKVWIVDVRLDEARNARDPADRMRLAEFFRRY